jgi:hypothetical protein
MRRLEEDHKVQIDATPLTSTTRRHGRMKNRRRLGAHSPPKPYRPPEAPDGKVNLSDLDSRNVKTPRGWVQGYDAQAATTEQQIVIAARVTVDSLDFGIWSRWSTPPKPSSRRRASARARTSC